MEEIMSDIRRGCESSRKLEASLPELSRHPEFLMFRCQEVVDVFTKAIDQLHAVCVEAHAAGSASSMPVMTLPLIGGMFDQFPSVPTYIGPGDSNISSGSQTPPMTGDGAVQRPEAGPQASVQRSSRKRKEGAVCTTIQVPATGNTENPPDDGYTWRKYGQKDILGSKYPRSYYRCTHKNYLGCDAKKQVQRLDQNPLIYEVTYCGAHSCQTSPTPLQLIPSILPPNHEDAPLMLNPSSSTEQLSSILGGLFYMDNIESVYRAGPSQAPQGGRDADCPVTDFADAMFNSGSSEGSMDVIFLTRQDTGGSGDNNNNQE